MKRIRVRAPIDRDAVSPDSIRAAHEFLTELLAAKAEGYPLDWNTYHTYTRRDRKGDLVIIAWAKVLR